MSTRDLKRASKKLGEINPNLLIGGAIVGVVGLGAVLLWRTLDPTRIPDKAKDAMGDMIIDAKNRLTAWGQNPYVKVDPVTKEKSIDWFGTFLTTISPGYALMSMEAKMQALKQKQEEHITPGATGPQ